MQPLPVGATDAHVTLPDADAALSAYRTAMEHSGFANCVLVQRRAAPEGQGAMLAALAAFGPAARGIAVVSADLPGPELDLLGAQGICGLRCQLPDPDGLMTWEGAAQLASRTAERGWHLELAFDPAEWPDREALIGSFPGTVVLDGRTAAEPDGRADVALRRALESGNIWIKLPDGAARARALVRDAADRCLWGSYWPELGSDLDLLLASLGAESEPTRIRILATNPATVYGFG